MSCSSTTAATAVSSLEDARLNVSFEHILSAMASWASSVSAYEDKYAVALSPKTVGWDAGVPVIFDTSTHMVPLGGTMARCKFSHPDRKATETATTWSLGLILLYATVKQDFFLDDDFHSQAEEMFSSGNLSTKCFRIASMVYESLGACARNEVAFVVQAVVHATSGKAKPSEWLRRFFPMLPLQQRQPFSGRRPAASPLRQDSSSSDACPLSVMKFICSNSNKVSLMPAIAFFMMKTLPPEDVFAFFNRGDSDESQQIIPPSEHTMAVYERTFDTLRGTTVCEALGQQRPASGAAGCCSNQVLSSTVGDITSSPVYLSFQVVSRQLPATGSPFRRQTSLFH